MADSLVIDSGRLIALARAGALEVVGSLGVVLVAPHEVRVELEEGARRGHVSIAPAAFLAEMGE